METRNKTIRRSARSEQTIVIRPAYADDDVALHRVAALDSAVVPAAPLLLGEVDGELRAALSLKEGTVVADPFFPTLHLVELLRSHANGDHPVPSRRRGYGFRLATRLA
jgi:hypothetical protein